MRYPNFVGGSFLFRDSSVVGERSINVYPGMIQSPAGRAGMALCPCPGVTLFGTAPDGPIRALYAEDATGRLFAVLGDRLVEFSAAGAPTVRGTLASDGQPAQIIANGSDQLCITNATKAYSYDLGTNTLTEEVTGATMTDEIDGFALALDQATGTLKISAENDVTSWDAADVLQRSAAPDPWVAMAVANSEIILLGARTGEVWYNAGLAPIPFAMRSSGTFPVGIAGNGWSLCQFAGSVAWLGQTTHGGVRVYWLNGYTPNAISHEGVEWAISQYAAAGSIADAVGWSYEHLGHQFYVLEFPTAHKTWVYDATTSLWHERGRWDPISADFISYRPRWLARAFNTMIVGDNQGPSLYALDETVYADVDGSPIRRVRILPHVSEENRRLFFDLFELDCERGVGLAVADGVAGADPQVILRASNNGGKTWGPERARAVGKRGAFDTRVRWDRCGSGRDRVWEISSSDPVPTYWFDAYVQVS